MYLMRNKYVGILKIEIHNKKINHQFIKLTYFTTHRLHNVRLTAVSKRSRFEYPYPKNVGFYSPHRDIISIQPPLQQ